VIENALLCSRRDGRRDVTDGAIFMRDPFINFLLLLVIGIVAGVIFDRVAGPGWLARQFTGPRSLITSALVGIAGSFIGFHLAVLLALAGVYAGYVAAAVGALIVLFLWRAIR
jgi:uncharacterized membrane protein YeaQ/YmgE (transglycosylase-associated protein family)